jgi:uncharacterized protein
LTHQEQNTIGLKQSKLLKFLLTFIVLFLLYHTAEYFIIFNHNAAGFFIFQIAFFITAYVLGNWYSKNGLEAWGLPLTVKLFKPLLIGIAFGVILYGIVYLISLISGIETITGRANFFRSYKIIIPFIFGLIFTSLSEDILTRGIYYIYLNNKIRPLLLITLSATIYLCNHIYRLNDDFASLLYLFLLGIIFIMPVIFTKNLWMTAGMHWGGNVFFYLSHDIIKNQTCSECLSVNYLFSICIVIFIPFLWFILKSNYVDSNSITQAAGS